MSLSFKQYVRYLETFLVTCCAELCLVAQSYLTLCGPHGLEVHQSPPFMEFSGKNTRIGCHATRGSSGDLPNPGIEPRSPALQVDSLPAEPPGNLDFKKQINIRKQLIFYMKYQVTVVGKTGII